MTPSTDGVQPPCNLKGDRDSEFQPSPVRVYITGANQWRDLPTFPAPNTTLRPLYLQGEGDAALFPNNSLLSWDKPQSENASDRYTYNPELPTPFEKTALQDRREIEIRADVLTFTTQPFEKPLTLLGDLTCVLYAASDCPDTDWFIHLTEVFPDGRSIEFYAAWSALRARYHQGSDKEVLLTPNKPTEFHIPLGACGHQFAAGNCLRLSISSAAFPAFDPNTNTGNTVVTDTECRVAKQSVLHDLLRPSHILLPIIDE